MTAVRSASRTLSIFEAFGREGRPLLLTELAPLVDIPLSSCHSLVKTLLAGGYLYARDRRRDLYPTRKLLNLAETISAQDEYLRGLLPRLEALRDEVRETVIVGTRQGDAVLYLQVLEGPQSIRYSARIGDFKPLHSSAIGKVLLATSPRPAFEAWLAGHALPRVTANTIVDPESLRADLAAGLARGYFVTQGENVADVTAVACPLRVNEGVIGVAVAGPSHRMGAVLDDLGNRLMAVCRSLEQEVR